MIQWIRSKPLWSSSPWGRRADKEEWVWGSGASCPSSGVEPVCHVRLLPSRTNPPARRRLVDVLGVVEPSVVGDPRLASWPLLPSCRAFCLFSLDSAPRLPTVLVLRSSLLPFAIPLILLFPHTPPCLLSTLSLPRRYDPDEQALGIVRNRLSMETFSSFRLNSQWLSRGKQPDSIPMTRGWA